MKISKDRFLVLLDYWASGAIYFGGGYWFLSQLKNGVATAIAWSFIGVGFFLRLVLRGPPPETLGQGQTIPLPHLAMACISWY